MRVNPPFNDLMGLLVSASLNAFGPLTAGDVALILMSHANDLDAAAKLLNARSMNMLDGANHALSLLNKWPIVSGLSTTVWG